MMLRSFIRRYVVHPLEALCAFSGYAFFALLPLDGASALGGWVARTIGPKLPISNRAVRNISRAFPDKSRTEIDIIVRQMWDNFGRVVAEYPHLSKFDVFAPNGRVEVVGVEIIDLLRDDGLPGLAFSAHIGNWEILSLAATQRGMPLDRVYRAANNPIVEWLFTRGRSAVDGALIPKGPAGVRPLLKSLKNGNHLALMIDQKMNDGIAVPFFGRDAMTATALVEFAQKFSCPVVPARVERLEGARFRIIVDPPLELTDTGDRHADVLTNMTTVNAIVEQWVRDTPGQWLWLHNRWPD
ncbi:MAG: lauroyl acyltransferase [Rhodospirillales bacterium]|jgi:Kdo2-lipid IVA lauroyltransferase/acyltransferase|nr:lauroyl acyltransferase [Rhodospirillales bacterium]